MAMVLQHALRGLCYKSGWAYAVFWKLKRGNRMLLTWEDGFYEFSKSSVMSSFDSAQPNGGYHTMNNEGRPGTAAQGEDVPGFEDEIGIAVAKMSYHMYSLGEGIIGRVAFTGKHQWVFGERGTTGESNGSGRSGKVLNEKYPAGWQQQFTAGIKTIAVVAVPHGVVQLGSRETVMEDLTLVSQVRTIFGNLQGVPGAFLSDYVPETQRGRVAAPSMLMPISMMGMGGANNMRSPSVAQMQHAQMSISNLSQIPTTAMGTGSYELMSMCKPAMPRRAHLHNPLLPSPVNALNPLSFQTSRVMPSPLMNKDLSAKNPSLLSTVSMAMGSRQNLVNIPFRNVCSQPPGPAALGVGSTVNPSQSPLVLMNWNSATPIPPVSQGKVRTVFDRTMQANHGMHHQLQTTLPVTGVSASQDTRISTKLPLQSTSTCATSASVLKVGRTDCKPSRTYEPAAYGPAESCQTELLRESSMKASDFTDAGVDTKSPRERRQLYNRSTGEVPLVQTRGLSPNVDSSNVDLSFKSPALQVPSGKCSHGVTHQKSLTESLDVSRSCVSDVNQVIDERKRATYSQPGKVENVCKETFVQSSQKLADVGGFGNPSVRLSKCIGNSIQRLEESTEGGKSADVLSEMTGKLWNGNLKSDWDCYSGLLNPFPIGDELSQALRPLSSKEGDRDPFSDMHPHHISMDTKGNSKVHSVGDTKLSSDVGEGKDIQNLTMDYDLFSTISDVVLIDSLSEPLLEAMVAGVSNVPVAPSPFKPDSSSQESTLTGCTSALSAEPESLVQRKESYPTGCSGETFEYDTTTDVPRKCDLEFQKLSGCGIDFQRETLYKMSQNPTELNGDEVHRRSDDGVGFHDTMVPAKRPEDFVKAGNSRKKAKHGDALRPRPKDRQLIQDRFRELREIVPNSCKCSIDALLERTIQHMHFLQSVTQQGGKWKQLRDLQEGDVYFPMEDSETSSNLPGVNEVENGASFPSTFGKLNSGCPIVVENLNQPRQLLVEILCEERGLFLEMADTVRRLGLTILKGTIESRSGKTWARFVVEAASRDIHRVEVLRNLMQLLQPTDVLQPSYDRAVNYTNPNCLYNGSLDCTSSSLSSSFPQMGGPSIPLQMTAR